MRSLRITLVRHGESHANTGATSAQAAGDHAIGLTEKGQLQARKAGQEIGASFLQSALVYTSPYRRTRETLTGILEGSELDSAGRAAIRVFEDPRLREVEHGYEDVDGQDALRRTHGWFYYRFRGGESPADCYDRTSTFLESMMRQVERKRAENALIVTHGLTIRCFVMRFLHMTVEQFDDLGSPQNCDIITIADREALLLAGFATASIWHGTGPWGVVGLRRRTPST